MEFGTTQMAVALFFLAGLIVLARLRKRIRAVDKTSFNYMSVGMVLLSLTAISQIFYVSGAYASLPMLSSSPFYHLLGAITSITGIACLVFGVSYWLPLERAHRRFSIARVQRLLFLKRVAQLMGIENRMPVVLHTTLEYMVEHYDLAKGAVYGCSRVNRNMRMIAGAGPMRATDDLLRQITFSDDAINSLNLDVRAAERNLIAELPDGLREPQIVLPVIANGALVAALLLWRDRDTELDAEDAVNLRLAADMIAARIESNTSRARVDLFQRRRDLILQAEKSVDSHRDLKDNLVRITGRLREALPHEHFSLTVFADGIGIQRLVIGETGAVLNEVGTRMREGDDLVVRVREEGRPRIYRDLEGERHPDVESVLVSSHMQSLMAIPITHGSQVLAVAVWASRVPGRYSQREVELVEGITSLLSRLILEENLRREAEQIDRRAAVLRGFIEELGRLESLDDVLATAARTLLDELKTSMVRISTFDEEEGFMKSRALASQRAVEDTAPADGWLITSLTPYHDLVRESGRLMLVNQESSDRKISEAEVQQVFGSGIRSALLTPIKMGDEVIGIISCGEYRQWSRYQYRQSDIQLVTMIAALIGSAAFRDRRPAFDRTTGFGPGRSMSVLDLDTRSRIKSSLTGILGSIEMLQARSEDPEVDIYRYLSIIDRSARRIGECVSDELVAAPTD